MNATLELTENPAVMVSDTPEGLSAIACPDCAAVIWERDPTAGFQAWIDSLEPNCLPSIRAIMPVEEAHETIAHICDSCGTPVCQEREQLIDDTAGLATRFADLVSARCLQLRFDVVTDNACSKFHVDTITARLVCTYRGTGTQFGIAPDGGIPDQVFTVPTGSPMVLRGKLWPETPESGLLHRSPPIVGTGETRLLLVLDPVYEPGEKQVPSSMH